MSEARVRATYRLQLHAGFGFREAAALADYLAELGISHLYASPYFQAAPGSAHGYDVVDPSRVNAELGGEAGHSEMCAALKAHGLGQILDIVPNHMAITGVDNYWWWDVLENGPASLYAGYFDVDWDSREDRWANRILLPLLGEHYGKALESGLIRLSREGSRFLVNYREHRLPVSPRALSRVLGRALTRCDSDELLFVADALRELPLAADPESAEKRHRGRQVLYRMLDSLQHQVGWINQAIDAALDEINADAELLDGVLEEQNYRLAFWRAAARELGYRRFFDINSLVGLRTEREEVFNDTHSLVLRWLRSGLLDGVRVDHPDGLRDPRQYFARLRRAAPDAWIIAEKILMPGERLPGDWPIDGTTGYEFLNLVLGLFIDPQAETAFTDTFAAFTGERLSFDAVARAKKRQVLRELLGSDLARLTELGLKICEEHRGYRDYTRHEIQEALRELLACFPVYRTYIRAEAGEVSDADQTVIDEALRAASEARPEIDGALLGFLRQILLLEEGGALGREFVMRFQQLSGPVAAKGVEDTAFYNFNRFIALNEVGGEPSRFGTSVEEFHAAAQERAAGRARAMLATSTHDSKRSEDVRARLAALSEVPELWRETALRWMAQNKRHKHGAPEASMEYFLYQTLVGAWPLTSERACGVLLKAMREAKTATAWTRPDEAYEKKALRFCRALMKDARFQRDLEAFVRPLIEPGRINALAQVLLKLTAPGVPDIYQGTELWDLSLVDPDNRRPVDFALNRRLMRRAKTMTGALSMQEADIGLPKMWMIRRVLQARRERVRAFEGGYTPLEARGQKAMHAVAFARGDEAVIVVPRLSLRLKNQWGDTSLDLPDGRWRNVLGEEGVHTGRAFVGLLLQAFPVALLVRED